MVTMERLQEIVAKWIVAVAALFILSPQPFAVAGERPQHIVSTNLCTDQLLLLLADPEQIGSVSFLALEPHSSYMADAAQGHHLNHGKTEELLALAPDLIVSSIYDDATQRQLLSTLGYRVEVFPMANNLELIRKNIRRMAALVGHPERGEALIMEMDKRIEAVAGKRPSSTPRALFYQARGYTSGKQTLQHEALQLAGWKNISAELGIFGYAPIDLESLLLAQPQQFFTSQYAPGTRSLAQQQLDHPALKAITAGKSMVNIDYRYWICGGPMIADAVEALAGAQHQ